MFENMTRHQRICAISKPVLPQARNTKCNNVQHPVKCQTVSTRILDGLTLIRAIWTAAATLNVVGIEASAMEQGCESGAERSSNTLAQSSQPASATRGGSAGTTETSAERHAQPSQHQRRVSIADDLRLHAPRPPKEARSQTLTHTGSDSNRNTGSRRSSCVSASRRTSWVVAQVRPPPRARMGGVDCLQCHACNAMFAMPSSERLCQGVVGVAAAHPCHAIVALHACALHGIACRRCTRPSASPLHSRPFGTQRQRISTT